MRTNGRAPATVSEIYPSKWLKASDLPKPVTVRIANVSVESVRQFDGSQALKPVISFERASKRLIANKTQCKSIAALIGSEAFTEWPGATVTLKPATAPNGKPTIAVVGPETERL